MGNYFCFNLFTLEGEKIRFVFEGKKISISINDLKKFDCKIYRPPGVLDYKEPPFEEDEENSYEFALESLTGWTKYTTAGDQDEYIICWAPSEKLAGITSFPTGARLQIKTPYEADLIINAQIDSILLRKSFKAKGSEALVWVSWNSKGVGWATEDGKPPKALARKKTPAAK